MHAYLSVCLLVSIYAYNCNYMYTHGRRAHGRRAHGWRAHGRRAHGRRAHRRRAHRRRSQGITRIDRIVQ